MTSPLCPPCSRLHELVREWNIAVRGDSLSRRDAAASALMDAAQQLPDAAAHRPDMPAGNDALHALVREWRGREVQTGYGVRDSAAFLLAACELSDAIQPADQPSPAGSPQTDHGASIAACAQQDRYPLLYALIQSGADVCAAIEAVLTERA